MTARVPNVVIGDTVPRSGAGSWPALGPTRASPPTRGHRSCEKFRSRRTPLLGKEGWLRPLIKCREASLTGADGVVGSTTDYRKLNLPFLPCFALSGSHYLRLRAAALALRPLRSRPSAPSKERDH